MKSKVIQLWINEMMTLLDVRYPNASKDEKHEYLKRIITQYYKDETVKLYNNYTGDVKKSTLHNIEEFYYSDVKPIMTEHGTMFHQYPENPASKMLLKQKAQRKILKKKMYSFDAESDEYANYDLKQSLKKIAMNAYYG